MANLDAFKKFLIVSIYAPPAISGSPLMMYNILQHFPQNAYCILTSHFGIDNKTIDKSGWLSGKYFYFDTPRDVAGPQQEETIFQNLKRFIKNTPFLRIIGKVVSLFYFPYHIVNRGKKIIKQEGIELLVGYSDAGPALLGTYLLHVFAKKPFFLFFYDLYAGNSFPILFRIVARFLEPRLFRDAEQIFVMSEALQDHYRKKYGRETVVIHNSIAIPIKRPGFSQGLEPYKIIFTGAVDWPQRQAILNLVRALEAVDAPQVQLYLYTPHEKSFLSKQGILEGKKIVFANALPQEMPEIQRTADILFVPLSFHAAYPLLINTSSPGKTYEYMVSGRPILVHAPRGSYIAEYAGERDFALVIDEDDPEQLKRAVLRLFNDHELVERLVQSAWKTAVENHDAKKESMKFQQYFLV